MSGDQVLQNSRDVNDTLNPGPHEISSPIWPQRGLLVFIVIKKVTVTLITTPSYNIHTYTNTHTHSSQGKDYFSEKSQSRFVRKKISVSLSGSLYGFQPHCRFSILFYYTGQCIFL